MPDDLVFADIAGHIVFDLDAAREAEKEDDEGGRPVGPSADAEEETVAPAE